MVEKGKIFLHGADYLDLLGFLGSDKFVVGKGKSIIEANFYLQKEDNDSKHGISKRPIYIQEKDGEDPRISWYPQEWYRIVQNERKYIGVADTVILTEHGEVPISSVIDETSDVTHLISNGSISNTNDIFSPTEGVHQMKFEETPVTLKIQIRTK